VTFSATVVPAPGAVALVGLAGLAGSRRRRA
jgi:MYXO-CTERM domain-containing protein